MARERPRFPPKHASSSNVTVDIIEGGILTQDANGFHATRRIIVSGLSEAPERKLYQALLTPGVPRFGSLHPAFTNLPCSRIEARSIDANKAEIDAEYFFPQSDGGFDNDPNDDTPQIEVSSVLVTQRTAFDVDGNPLLVQLETLDDNDNVLIEDQIGEAEVQIPMHNVIYRRREARSPGLISTQFVGHVNSVGVFGDPERMWLCTQLDGFTEDRGLTWNVTYAFQRNPFTWDVTVYWRGGEGRPRIFPEANPGFQGHKTYQIYPAADFNQLNLTV